MYLLTDNQHDMLVGQTRFVFAWWFSMFLSGQALV